MQIFGLCYIISSWMYTTPIVISLGGSLIIPNGGVDHLFLKRFRASIISKIEEGKRFIIVAGGGAICRHYQKAAQDVGPLNPEDVDWIGVHVTHLNAHLLRTIFRDYAHLKVVTHYTEKEEFDEPLLIAAGWKPGHSTDFDAVRQAKLYEADTVINLSNIPYVYDSDPNKNEGAKPLQEISWASFRKLVGDTWDPGANHPFDPIAAKEAEKLKLRVVVMDGKNLGNFENFLSGKKFEGTVIS
ncbi:MAG: UMP kinase [Candidatus Woykebacteria bacterium]